MTFNDLLTLIEAQRPGFRAAIGATLNNTSSNSYPAALAYMYEHASGTREAIEDQALMDIIPGMRLIHKDELDSEIAEFKLHHGKLKNHLPFLADYSSCYTSLNIEDACVYRVAKEYGSSKVSNSLETYWQTVYTCYEEEAFYLDAEGYLDFNFVKEGLIGERFNRDCEYWIE